MIETSSNSIRIARYCSENGFYGSAKGFDGSAKGFDGSAKGFDGSVKGFVESVIGCSMSDPLPDNAQFAELKPARF